MSERITTDDVAKVAKLARLRLRPDELTRFTEQLDAVLDHAEDLQTLDLDDLEPLAHPAELSNVLRADRVGALLDRDEVLASAPQAENGRYRVPPVLREAP